MIEISINGFFAKFAMNVKGVASAGKELVGSCLSRKFSRMFGGCVRRTNNEETVS